MASMRISDVFVPQAQRKYIQERSTTLSAFWRSGIVGGNDFIARALSSVGGNTFKMPFNKSIEDDVAEDGNDDPTDLLVPAKLTTGTVQAVRQAKAKSWSQMELASLLAQNNPTEAVSNMLAKFWTNNYQSLLLSALIGIYADNDANDAGDMTHNIYSDVASGSLTAANLVSSDAIIESLHTMGDHSGDLGAIAMHSDVRKELKLQEPNSFIPASESNIGFETYQGLVIVEDDGMTVTAGSNTPSYSTYLFGAGAIAYENDSNIVLPETIDRVEASGNGMGEEILHTRRSFVFHPQGFEMTEATADTPVTKTDLETAARWDRKAASRKQIKIARLLSNG